jgi:hypothetical protein
MHENGLQQTQQVRCKTLGGKYYCNKNKYLLQQQTETIATSEIKHKCKDAKHPEKTNATKKNEMLKQQTKAIATAKTKKQCEMQHQKNTNATKEDY